MAEIPQIVERDEAILWGGARNDRESKVYKDNKDGLARGCCRNQEIVRSEVAVDHAGAAQLSKYRRHLPHRAAQLFSGWILPEERAEWLSVYPLDRRDSVLTCEIEELYFGKMLRTGGRVLEMTRGADLIFEQPQFAVQFDE